MDTSANYMSDTHNHDHHMDMNHDTASGYADITTFGTFHGTSSHTHHDSLEGGRAPITTEAFVSYNGLRAFLGEPSVALEDVGAWAYANQMTNNPTPFNDTEKGVGLYYGMQAAKVGWIRDDAFDPQILADIQREARLGTTENVMAMVEEFGLPGYANYLQTSGLVDAIVNTLKMEPHYGGWMHGVVHGGLQLDGAVSHDVNHLTVLSHDQTRPFMNDTFDYPQWSALDVPPADVANYFQSMVLLSDPLGEGIVGGTTGVDNPVPVDMGDPDPANPDMGGETDGSMDMGHDHDHGDGMDKDGDTGSNAGSGTVGGGQTYAVGSTAVVTNFNPATDVLDLGADSIHNQIAVDTADGFMMVHMFDASKSLLLEGVFMKDLSAGNFAPIADAHLQQDLSASLAFENGTGLVRENTVYVRSHEANLVEVVDFNPATDTVSMFYLSVRGDQGLNFVAEDTAEGARFYSPITGQSLTLRGVSLSDLDSSHFEWRANQIEDNVAGRMGLAEQIDGFSYDNIYGGKSVPMAGLVDRAPYHSQPDYTGTPIGGGTDNGGDMGGGDAGGVPINVTVTGGSVTEGDPGMEHMHSDGSSHVHDDGHRYIVFNVTLDTPASQEVTLNYATTDGLAVADTTNSTAWDYHETNGTLVFAQGEQAKTVTVAVHPDTIVELTETFTFAVSGENITGDLIATGVIYDNDVADPTDSDGGMDMGGDPDPIDPVIGAVAFDTSNQWADGFVAQGTFAPAAATNGWTISFASNADITNIWNAVIVSYENGIYRITNESYNASLGAGQEVSFGFQAAGSDTAITDIIVNGEPVGDGGVNPNPVDPDPVDPTPVDPDPVDPDPDMGGGNPDPVDPDPVDPDPVTPGDGGGSYDSGNGSPFTASDYASVLDKSMNFYYANYAGKLDDDHPISWRGDSTLTDGADVGRDLSGGMFDAGDHVKFGLPMASTATVLAWGGIEFEQGYKASNGYADLDSHLRQLNDYFLQAYDDNGTADLSDDVFHAQVGDGHLDHAYWGAPEDMTMERPTFSVDAQNPGSDVTGETAAAMAASSIFFRNQGDTAYADQLLEKAIQLFSFAETYQGKYSDAIQNVVPFYNSWSGFEDELAWSANWLYQATGDASYLAKSEQYYSAASQSWAMNWDDKGHPTALFLADQTGNARYVNDINGHLDFHMNGIHKLDGTDTNDGLAWVDQWGSNRYAANTALLAQVQAKIEAENGNEARAETLRNFATDQLDYMMGDNPDGFSYVVGFGDDFPLNPHHRGASGTTYAQAPGENKYILEGALVGGPGRDGSYNDDRNDYITNEVTTDYNAGFSGALAGAVEGLVAADSGPVVPDPMPVDPVPVDPMPVDPMPMDPTPVDPAPTDPAPDGVLSAYMDVQDDWGSGAVVELTLTNNTGRMISDWDITFDLPVGIMNAWNADLGDGGGDRASLDAVDWNSMVADGQSIIVGFQTVGGGLNEDEINMSANFSFDFV